MGMERHERTGIRHQVLKKLRDSFLYTPEATFTLSSGRKSRYYIDCKKVTLDAEGAYLIARLVLDAIGDDDVDAIGGMTLGADPIAVATAVLSYQTDRPISAFVVRKEPKTHGTTAFIEGTLVAGSRIVVVDDVLTSGASTERTIGILKDAGCKLVKVLALVDRKEGGRDRLTAAGYQVDTLFTVEDLLKA
ncbi:MAG: orotate phosphoribosyltransferase [Nitrospiria bacterium]